MNFGRGQVAPFELCTKLMDAAVAQGAKLVLGKVEGVTTVQEGASGSVPKVNGVIVDGASFRANPTFWDDQCFEALLGKQQSMC